MYHWKYKNKEYDVSEILLEANLKNNKDDIIKDYLSSINIEKEVKRLKSGIDLRDEEKFLEYLVNNYKIFIDTCSLVKDESYIFFEKLENILQKNKKQIYVPLSVIKEIDKIIIQKNNDKNMIKGKYILSKFQKKNLLCILDDKGQNFADNVFNAIFTLHRLKYNLCLITQDRALAWDILNLYKCSSVKVDKDVQVIKVGVDGKVNKTIPQSRN